MTEEKTNITENTPESPAAAVVAQEPEQKWDAASFPLKTVLGIKVGMAGIYSEGGQVIPVSVIDASSCVLTHVKTAKSDGYNAVQLGIGECKQKNLTKAYLTQFKKKDILPLRWLREFRVQTPEKFRTGTKLSVEIFSPGDIVDISGISRGKGFAGVMKRHGFAGLPASHGASDKERSRGSSGGGSGQPQRVLKGTRMAGRMGSDWVTTQNLEVVKVDRENQWLMVKGAVPGPVGNLLVVKETTKHLKHKRPPMAPAKSAKKQATKKSAPPKPAAKK
ncbi:MAG: 50S ribosomal protein L3 [Elusimicrobia bacterium]|nr:50S ribosomal protein L3 [Elusimicrobiota bacterium]